MTVDRDPNLEALFAKAKQVAADDGFTDGVMSRIDKLRKRSMIGWIGVGVVMVALAWTVSSPVTHAVHLATQLLPESLVELDDRWMAQLLAPVNSIAGLVGLGFLGLRLAYKKIFS